jgi:transcriptional regulator with XRE-family HTH domain
MPVQGFPNDLDARVRAARAYAGLTRLQLAVATERPEITDRLVARFEDPHLSSPNQEQVQAIARACGLPASFFTADFDRLDERLSYDQVPAFERLRDAIEDALAGIGRRPDSKP